MMLTKLIYLISHNEDKVQCAEISTAFIQDLSNKHISICDGAYSVLIENLYWD